MENKNSLISLWSDSLRTVDPRALCKSVKSPILPGDAILTWGKAALRTWEALSPRFITLSKLKPSKLKPSKLAPSRLAPSNLAPSKLIDGPPALVIAPRRTDRDTTDREIEVQFESGKGNLRGARVVFAEHPLPGKGSFEAGRAILDFFDQARRTHSKQIRVFLSGGASSLAWLPPLGLTDQALEGRLARLYASDLSIERLNQERSLLCLLKAGGAAKLARTLAPHAKLSVDVISDVAPFGVEVVGSGPFFDGTIPHRVVADNAIWVQEIERLARDRGFTIAIAEGMRTGDRSQVWLGGWRNWVTEIESQIARLTRIGLEKKQLIVLGGEPTVALPPRSSRSYARKGRSRESGRGGRQAQIAAQLALRYAPQIAQGKIEILCASSDGVDGKSGGAGVYLGVKQGRAILHGRNFAELKRSIAQFDTASVLAKLDALIPERPTGTNVQDVILIRLN